MKAIEVKQLTKRFGTFTAVDHISFEVEPGEIFGFLGANGAGKTTAMRMLCGLSVPTSGEARVAGFDVYRESESIKRNIGYMSQKFSLYGDLKVWENIRLFGGIYGFPNAIEHGAVLIIFQSRTQAFFAILFIDFSIRNNRFFILYAKRIFFENRDIIFSGVWLPQKNGAEA